MEERKREAERQTAKDRKKEEKERRLNEKEEKIGKRKREEVASLWGPSKRLQTRRDDIPNGRVSEVVTSTTEFEAQNRPRVENSKSDSASEADNRKSEALVAELLNTRSCPASTVLLQTQGVMDALLVTRHKRPPTCSGCGVQGHTFRACSQNPGRKV